MNARSEQDNNIGWVKSELEETLTLARQALEVYVENPSDDAQLRFVTTHLHQVVGTLQIVELYGAALLAEEAEQVVNELIKGSISQKDDAYEVIMRAILQLPAYLDHIQQGFKDNPVNLLPLLNDLRTARGHKLLSEHAFFSPNLDVFPDKKSTPRSVTSSDELPNFAKKLRPLYQTGLVGLFRNTDVQKNLKLLATVIRQLENSVDSDNAKQLLWICGGVIEGLYNQGLEANVSLKSLLGQVDRLIKKLVDGGEDTFKNEIPQELLKNLLYYVAQAKPNGSRVNELQQAFKLNSLLPDSNQSAQDELTGFGTDVIKNVSKAIKEDILSIKDSLDIFVRSESTAVSDLEPLCEKLNSVADTLGLLGMGKLRKLIKEQEQVVSDVIKNEEQLDDSVVMGIASALLFVESSVNDLRLANINEEDDDDPSSKLIPDSEYNQLVELTITEAKTILARVKDAFIAFAADTSKHELLENVPNLINEIKGAFVIVSFGRAADLINSCSIYIQKKLLDSKTIPEQNELEALADSITGIEYFLENFASDSSGARKSLDISQESLIKLGFPPENLEPIEAIPESTGAEKIDIASLDHETTAPATESEPEPESLELSNNESTSIDEEVANIDTAEPVTSEANVSEADASESNDLNFMDDEDEGPDPEILEIFLEEAEEEFASITEQLTNWEANLSDENALSSLRRSFHTLKGSGRIVGATEIGEFAWAIENMLNRVIDKAIETSPTMMAILGQARDVLPELIDQIKGKGAPVSNIQLIADNAHKISAGETVIIDAQAVSTGTNESSINAADTIEHDIESGIEEPPTYDPVLAEIFTNETKTHISAIRQFIGACNDNGLPCQINNDLIRALHTLHGSAHMASVTDVAEVSDQLEKYAKLILENQTNIDSNIITLFVNSVDAIEVMIGQLASGTTTLANKSTLLEQITALYEAELAVQKERLGGMEEGSEHADSITIDDELVQIFLKETDEIIEQTHNSLDEWVKAPDNTELADEIRRQMHTLKGGAKIANLPVVADISGHLENLLSQAVDNMIPFSSDLITVSEEIHKWLSDYFALRNKSLPITPQLTLEKINLQKKVEALSLGFTGDDIQIEEVGEIETPLELIGTDGELVDIFVIEAQDILNKVNEALDNWSLESSNISYAEELQRAMHILKGGARMAKLTVIGDVTQKSEQVLIQIIDATLQPNNDIMSALRASYDWTKNAIDSLQTKQALLPHDELLAQLDALLNSSDASASAPGHKIDTSLDENFSPGADDDTTLSLDDGLSESIEQEDGISLSDFDSSWDTDDTSEEQYDDDLTDIFLEEAAEILHKMDDLLHQWQGDPESKEIIEEVQRALHTLKGGARMANIAPIGDLSHSIETVLEKITAGHLNATDQLVEIVQSSYDWLNNAITQIGQHEPLSSVDNLINEIEISVGLKERTEVADTAPLNLDSLEEEHSDRLSAAFAIENLLDKEESDFDMSAFVEDTPAEEQQEKSSDATVKVSANLLDNLVNFAGEVSIYRSRVDQQLGSIGYNLTEFDQTIARVGEQLRKFEIEAEAQILFRYESNVTEGSEDFDPLELDRFSNMQQLSRSLVESLGDLNSIRSLLENYTRESEILLLQQSRVSSELQEGLIRTRLVPFSSAVPRLRRIIRQTAKELGKTADFKIIGAEGEMDRTVLDRVVPAIEHMLRNAIDHGIEIPDLRSEKGKPETGRIMLSFRQEGPKIVIRIQDDGAGMNLKAIREKAIERGLMVKDSDLSDNEIMQFVLESGFSTAQNITQISGRGVGMDVVNTEIKQVAGTLHIDTKENKGSIFTIQLPLTVSANQALIIETGDDHYAIPLSSVDGVIRVSDKELTKLFAEEKPVYQYGGRKYGFFHLGSILGVSKPLPPAPGTKVTLILARAGDHSVALLIEQIVGRQEIVIKSVGPQISTVNGISGATIMGDGGIALILDISSLIREGLANMAKIEIERERLETEKAAAISDIPKIMIVDDSITVRKVTERLLKRHNMEPLAAKDGIDALDKLEEQIPDLMLLDIEMPRMDGFELATAMRNDDRYKNIPIIMITSRTGDKHRERALKIGVNRYLGKPFQEPELLENIESLLNESE